MCCLLPLDHFLVRFLVLSLLRHSRSEAPAETRAKSPSALTLLKAVIEPEMLRQDFDEKAGFPRLTLQERFQVTRRTRTRQGSQLLDRLTAVSFATVSCSTIS